MRLLKSLSNGQLPDNSQSQMKVGQPAKMLPAKPAILKVESLLVQPGTVTDCSRTAVMQKSMQMRLPGCVRKPQHL